MLEKIAIGLLLAILAYLIKEFFSAQDLEKENSELKSKVLKYENKEAIFAKYEKHEKGYFIHKETKHPFCPSCLQKPEILQNQLTQRENDFLFCESCDYAINPPFPDVGLAPPFRSDDF